MLNILEAARCWTFFLCKRYGKNWNQLVSYCNIRDARSLAPSPESISQVRGLGPPAELVTNIKKLQEKSAGNKNRSRCWESLMSKNLAHTRRKCLSTFIKLWLNTLDWILFFIYVFSFYLLTVTYNIPQPTSACMLVKRYDGRKDKLLTKNSPAQMERCKCQHIIGEEKPTPSSSASSSFSLSHKLDDAMEPSSRWLKEPTLHRQIVAPRARAYTLNREDKRGRDYRDHMLHLGWHWTSSRAKQNKTGVNTAVVAASTRATSAELGAPASGRIRMGQIMQLQTWLAADWSAAVQ